MASPSSITGGTGSAAFGSGSTATASSGAATNVAISPASQSGGWDPEEAEDTLEWNPPRNKVFTGGEPVVPAAHRSSSQSKRAERSKVCSKVEFTFSSKQLAALIERSEKGDASVAADFYNLAMQYDKGDARVDGEKCLKKAFQCYKAAARDGFIPALKVLQSRVMNAADARQHKVFIELSASSDAREENHSRSSRPSSRFVDAAHSQHFPILLSAA